MKNNIKKKLKEMEENNTKVNKNYNIVKRIKLMNNN